MHKGTTLTSLVLAAGLALAGCSSNPTATPEAPSETAMTSQIPSESPSPERVNLDEPFYVKTPEGSEIVVDFSAEPPADIEEYRIATGTGVGTYATVDIDNRQGTEYSSVYQVTLYDEEGNSYPFQDVELYHFSEWGPTFTEDYDYVMPDGTVLDEATANKFEQMEAALYEKYFDDGADPLERSQSWIATPGELPDDIVGVSIEANGSGSGTAMVPLSEKDSYVVPDDGTGPQVVGPPPST